MNKMTDNDLILLYYGEHDDPMLARRVANSPELSARFEALCAELKKVDNFVPPERSEDFLGGSCARLVVAGSQEWGASGGLLLLRRRSADSLRGSPARHRSGSTHYRCVKGNGPRPSVEAPISTSSRTTRIHRSPCARPRWSSTPIITKGYSAPGNSTAMSYPPLRGVIVTMYVTVWSPRSTIQCSVMTPCSSSEITFVSTTPARTGW